MQSTEKELNALMTEFPEANRDGHRVMYSLTAPRLVDVLEKLNNKLRNA